jgi:hypothetical protein
LVFPGHVEECLIRSSGGYIAIINLSDDGDPVDFGSGKPFIEAFGEFFGVFLFFENMESGLIIHAIRRGEKIDFFVLNPGINWMNFDGGNY